MYFLTSLIVASSFLVTATSAKLSCSSDTLRYRYVNHVTLFGNVESKILVETEFEVDCQGQSHGQRRTAYDLVIHIVKSDVTIVTPKSENVDKLCKAKKGGNCNQTATDNKVHDKAYKIPSLFQLKQPFVIIQADNGDVIALKFKEVDLELKEVVNFKRDIAAALQTHIGGDGDISDSDILGWHKTHVKTTRDKNGADTIQKKYNTVVAGPEAGMQSVMITVFDETKVDNGELVMSKGSMKADATYEEDDNSNVDPDQKINIDLNQLTKAHTSYVLKLMKRLTRGEARNLLLAKLAKTVLIQTTMTADTKSNPIDDIVEDLANLYEKLIPVGVQKSVAMFPNEPKYLQLIEDIIFLETELGLPTLQKRLRRRQYIVDELIPASDSVLLNCNKHWSKCMEIANVITAGEGELVEGRLLYLLGERASLNLKNWTQIMNSASRLPRPSDHFVNELIHMLHLHKPGSDEYGALLLVITSLGRRESVSSDTKPLISTIVLEELRHATDNGLCVEDVRSTDALEAAGNLGDMAMVDTLMHISSTCKASTVMRVAIFHSVRFMLKDVHVQDMLVDSLRVFNCEIIANLLETIVGVLENTKEKHDWPMNGVNEFDEVLARIGMSNNEKGTCLRKVAIKYFKLKAGERSKTLLSQILEKQGKETTQRQKRHASCSVWNTHNGLYNYINRWTHASDNQIYNKRRHCLAYFRLGPSLCQAHFYAGFFVGFRKWTCRVKMFGKVVATGKIIRKTFIIAIVEAYWIQYSCTNKVGRVYVRVGDRTIINQYFYHKPSYSRSWTLFSYQKRIPILKIRVYIFTLDLTAILTARVWVSANLRFCYGVQICFDIVPQAEARVYGNVRVKAVVALAGADIGVILNYYIGAQLRVTFCKYPCLYMYHGHNPMVVFLHFYWQYRTITWKKWWIIKRPVIVWSGRKYIGWLSRNWKVGGSRRRTIYNGC